MVNWPKIWWNSKSCYLHQIRAKNPPFLRHKWHETEQSLPISSPRGHLWSKTASVRSTYFGVETIFFICRQNSQPAQGRILSLTSRTPSRRQPLRNRVWISWELEDRYLAKISSLLCKHFPLKFFFNPLVNLVKFYSQSWQIIPSTHLIKRWCYIADNFVLTNRNFNYSLHI